MLEYRRVLNGVCKRLGLTDGTGKPEQDGVIYGELEKRLIPEGYEWPRFEDGEPVEAGDEFMERGGVRNAVHYVAVGIDWFEVYGFDGASSRYSKGERLKRPTVLAADGEPLEVGQTVYHTDTGLEYQIHSINDDGKGAFVYNNSLGQDAAGLHLCHVGNLTHQRPVLDADGVPIELGDDLYSVEGGLKLHVSIIDKVNCRIATSAMFALDKWADPSMFTHTKHEIDSLERIADEIDRLREDVAQHLGDYLYDEDGNDSIQFSMECVAKRCRALAYRSE